MKPDVKSCFKWRRGSGINLTDPLPTYREMLQLAREFGVPKQELDCLLDTHEYFIAAELIAEKRALQAGMKM